MIYGSKEDEIAQDVGLLRRYSMYHSTSCSPLVVKYLAYNVDHILFQSFHSPIFCFSFYSAEKDLKSFEKKHNVLQRWDLASKTAKDLLQEVIEEERQELVRNLRVLAYERLFLIDLKRKYAGMFYSCIVFGFYETIFELQNVVLGNLF